MSITKIMAGGSMICKFITIKNQLKFQYILKYKVFNIVINWKGWSSYNF